MINHFLRAAQFHSVYHAQELLDTLGKSMAVSIKFKTEKDLKRLTNTDGSLLGELGCMPFDKIGSTETMMFVIVDSDMMMYASYTYDKARLEKTLATNRQVSYGSNNSKKTCLHCHTEGKMKRCSGCLLAKYCSKECQKAHWKEHRQLCKAAHLTH